MGFLFCRISRDGRRRDACDGDFPMHTYDKQKQRADDIAFALGRCLQATIGDMLASGVREAPVAISTDGTHDVRLVITISEKGSAH
jgi:hypothetical protein